jgi:hypothetical protein
MIIMTFDLDDNRFDACMPFKGPFKGKGQNRVALRQMETQLSEIMDEMDRLVAEFNHTLPSTPRPVNLRILRRSNHHPLLSWRYAVRSGSYLKLFGSAQGHHILHHLGPHARQLLARFDRERLHLNFRCKLIWNCRDAYVLHEAGIRDLEAYETPVTA